MNRVGIRTVRLAVIATVALVLLAVGVVSSQQKKGAQKAATSKAPVPARPIAMVPGSVGLEITLGLKDKEQVFWEGDIAVAGGRILNMEILRAGQQSTVKAGHFKVRARRGAGMALLPPVLKVALDAPLTAKVTVKTKGAPIEFALGDLPAGAARLFQDSQVSIERQDAAVRLTGPSTEDDHPALARAADGSIWLTYLEYQPGPEYLVERVRAGDFASLVPRGNGDHIKLMRFDGESWQVPVDVTEGDGLSIWRPTLAIDGKGNVVIAWGQQVDGDWEIFSRRYTPAQSGEGQWSPIQRLTRNPGSDFAVAAATAADGKVWLAWQSWRKDNFDIILAAVDERGLGGAPGVISASSANDWSPALAADKLGNVCVAYDTYDKGNYDVELAIVGKEPRRLTVASSPRFEARASLVCDSENRLWIAYEEGDEQWGKDFSNDQYQKIGFKSNPGNGLYGKRTIKVKCLADGKLQQPAGDLEAAFKGKLVRNKSIPRLAVDAAGAVWLLVRHHPSPTGGPGEVWDSFALRYDGQAWSPPRRLASSAGLMDNRPGLVAQGTGLLAVYSSDNRLRTQNRAQADLHAAVLHGSSKAASPGLTAVVAVSEAKMPVVHPNETADVARMRGSRIESAGRKLRLLRGEFHRHTEYTSHRDIDGTLEDSWRYGLDAGALDWMGNGDHDNGYHHEYMWWSIQKMTDLFNNPPTFVAALTYERSNVYPNGHRNVILPKRGIRPLPRGDLKGTPETGTPDTKLLYAYLKHFGGICSSHTSGTSMGTDWRDNDPEVEPVVEIYQGHRHNYEHSGAPRSATKATNIGGYEPAGYVWNAFEKGHRLGFQCSSDHISTHISYAVVLTDDASRQGLIDAFKKRHSYGATDNIILDIRSGGRLMGDIFTTDKRPSLDIHVRGTGPVAKVSVIRDNKYVYSTEPRTAEVKLHYADMDARPGQTSYYYVRIEQADGNLAWGSPMWITYKP